MTQVRKEEDENKRHRHDLKKQNSRGSHFMVWKGKERYLYSKGELTVKSENTSSIVLVILVTHES